MKTVFGQLIIDVYLVIKNTLIQHPILMVILSMLFIVGVILIIQKHREEAKQNEN